MSAAAEGPAEVPAATGANASASASVEAPPSEGRRALRIVYAAVIASFVLCLFLHRDLTLYEGNSEWDYIGQNYTRGEGVVERTASLVDALRPDGRYGQGISVSAWLVRAGLDRVGVHIDGFRASMLVSAAFSLMLVLAAQRLAEALGVRRDLRWIAPLAVSCSFTFVALAVQVNADVTSSAPVALAAVPLFLAPSSRGAFASGALLGAAFLFRQSALPYLLLYGFIQVVLPGEPAPLRARLRAAAVMALAFALPASMRVAADLLQTGRPLYHDQAEILRALFFEGGLNHYHPDPRTSLGEIIARDPGLFFGTILDSYAYYMRGVGPAIFPSLALLLWRAPALRRRTLVALLLALGYPLGPAAIPTPCPRYILCMYPLVTALGARALEEVILLARPRLPRLAALVPWLVAAGLGALFLLQTAILVDRYLFEFPEAEVRAAVERGGLEKAPVLVRSGFPEDKDIYFLAIRYRMRRLGLHTVPAPAALDAAECARQGFPGPFLVLRVPIPSTGRRILFDLARGKPRKVFSPEEDPCLASAGAERLVRDERSGIELWRVERPPPAREK